MDLEQKLRSLPKLIKIEIMTFFPSKKLLKIYKYNKEFQNYLKINDLYILFSNKILNEKNQAILTNCENKLYNLIIWKNIEECTLTFLSNKLCNIKEINLTSLSLKFDYNIFCTNFLKNQKNLKYLHIQNPMKEFNVLSFPNLEELSLKFCYYRINEMFQINYIEKIKSFEVWHLLGDQYFDDFSDFNMMNNLNNLEFLINSTSTLLFCIFLIKQNNKINTINLEITYTLFAYIDKIIKSINDSKNLININVKTYSECMYNKFNQSIHKINKNVNINLIN